MAPFPHRPPPTKSDKTIKFLVNMTESNAWSLGVGSHQAFRQQLPPILWDENSRGQTTYGENQLQNGSIVDIIYENGAHVTSQHPFHKHNIKAWIIGTGHGGFPWETVAEAIEGGAAKNFNFKNPPLRDGARLGNKDGDWTVIRYEIAFPAVSMLHCHMIHHFGVSFFSFFNPDTWLRNRDLRGAGRSAGRSARGSRSNGQSTKPFEGPSPRGLCSTGSVWSFGLIF